MYFLVPLSYHILFDYFHGVCFFIVFVLDEENFAETTAPEDFDGDEVGDGGRGFGGGFDVEVRGGGGVGFGVGEVIVIFDFDRVAVLVDLVVADGGFRGVGGHEVVLAVGWGGARTQAAHKSEE